MMAVHLVIFLFYVHVLWQNVTWNACKNRNLIKMDYLIKKKNSEITTVSKI